MEEQQNQPQNPHLFYWGDTPEQEYYTLQGIRSSNSFYTSPRGLKLFTRSWLPKDSTTTKGVIFMVHGYGNDISWTFQATPIFLAKHGYACFALDLEGHGQSQGLKAFVPNVDFVIDDWTVIELLRVTDYLSSRLCDVDLPFIVFHGNADVVTDPQVSKELYECAKNEDKNIKIYDGMLHSLLFGETDENVEIVRNDILTWLNNRS
ncbi:hypothetical protein Leryth_027032 [Lithospermum erythrorhizon]|nr:hypothetical protein Leryth_027032 [Lithospermum erythrorhizon]